ncbi:MAG: outer membrane beta-barrel protein [Bacteroidota bacterium]|nr:outer membrane beta-barrel protein [Bacteroidota bacterium]
MKKWLQYSCLIALIPLFCIAKKGKFNLEGGFDFYYVNNFKDFNNKLSSDFLFNHARQNDFTINFAYLKASYNGSDFRFNFGGMFGNYVQFNLDKEPYPYKYFYEANFGFRLINKFWVMGGIIPSHIGAEQVLSRDNFTLTRSLCAENSPYYELGIRFSYEPNERWLIAAFVLNGWQKLKLSRDYSMPSFGTQIKYQLLDYITINHSSFIGTASPDSAFTYRFFSNLYAQFNFKKRISLYIGFDYGWQQQSKGNSKYFTWYTPYFVVKYGVTKKFFLIGRYENFYDPNNVVTPVGTPYLVKGYSGGIELKPFKFLSLRSELKYYDSSEALFEQNEIKANQRLILTSSLIFAF